MACNVGRSVAVTSGSVRGGEKVASLREEA